jgi:hypothetical protein
MARNPKAVGTVRIALGLLALVALAVGLDRDAHVHDGGNFLFYFTNLSNLFGAFVFLTGGTALLRGRPGLPALVRGASVLYLVITGLVFWTLLSNTITPETIVWQNDVVHGVMPVAFLLDWLLVPPTVRLALGRAAYWLVFPLVYLGVSLVRGPMVGWYPYDFLDPREPGGYAHVTTWSLIVTVVFVVFMLLLVAVGNRLRPGARTAAAADQG